MLLVKGLLILDVVPAVDLAQSVGGFDKQEKMVNLAKQAIVNS